MSCQEKSRHEASERSTNMTQSKAVAADDPRAVSMWKTIGVIENESQAPLAFRKVIFEAVMGM